MNQRVTVIFRLKWHKRLVRRGIFGLPDRANRANRNVWRGMRGDDAAPTGQIEICLRLLTCRQIDEAQELGQRPDDIHRHFATGERLLNVLVWAGRERGA